MRVGGGAGGPSCPLCCPSLACSVPAAWESSGHVRQLGKGCGPWECSLAGQEWLLGLGVPCQLGSHMLQVFGSPLLIGVPGHLVEHVWLEPLIFHYLEARESLQRSQGPVKIMAVMAPACSISLGCGGELGATLPGCLLCRLASTPQAGV